jgi:hypothetical protein
MKQLAEHHKTAIASVIALGILAIAAYFYTVGEAPGRDTIGVPEPKLTIEQICRDSLAYTTLEVGADAEVYVQDCIAGKFPQVIETHVQRLNEQNNTPLAE